MDGIALSWFQTIACTTLEDLEKDFYEAFFKTSIKHNTIIGIYNFKQDSHESVQDSVNKLRQYILQLPKVVSIFLKSA